MANIFKQHTWIWNITLVLAYANTLDIQKRSIGDNFFLPKERTSSKRKFASSAITPKKSSQAYRNDSAHIWQPLKGYPTPVYVKKPVQSGNHSYKVVFNNRLPPKSVPSLISTKNNARPIKKSDVAPVYNPVDKAEERNYANQNITTYEKKKLPRFLLPFPFGLYTKDPIRPFPSGSVFTLLPAIIVPFIPFGIWEIRLPVVWGINYIIERFNGYDDGSLTAGRQGRSFTTFPSQQKDFYTWTEDLLSNTLGMDGKACMLRLICELAEAPVEKRSLMGEILHRLVE